MFSIYYYFYQKDFSRKEIISSYKGLKQLKKLDMFLVGVFSNPLFVEGASGTPLFFIITFWAFKLPFQIIFMWYIAAHKGGRDEIAEIVSMWTESH